MTKPNKKDKRTELDKEIDSLYEALRPVTTDEPEYEVLLKNIERLEKVRNERERNKEHRKKVDPNTLLVIGGNLAGVVLIMYLENNRPILTKAFGTLLRPRI